MKNKYLFVLLMLICIALGGLGLTGVYVSRQDQRDQEQNLTVVTSFYPMYIAAMNVIGDTPGVTLENLSEPQTGCLHDYQLSTEEALRRSSQMWRNPTRICRSSTEEKMWKCWMTMLTSG